MTRRRKAVLFVIAAVVAATTVDYWLYPRFARPSGTVVNRGENALWLRYTWAFGEHTAKDTAKLAQRLEAHGIRDAYFHVRSILPDGSLKYRERLKTAALNHQVARLAPSVRKIAWIYAGNPQGLGAVNLARSDVRRRMASEAAWLVQNGGFDGVQWDYEICPDGDPNLLRLLEETRRALPAGTYLSAAVPGWYPSPLGGFGWSPAYFGEVAKRCDGIAVMAYDSAAYLPRVYAGWITQQTIVVTRAVAAANPRCGVVLGIPTYGDGTASHNPRAENLRLALLGVRNGLAQGTDLDVWKGVGLFADYTTDEDEWSTFDELWPLKNAHRMVDELSRGGKLPEPPGRSFARLRQKT